MTLHSILSCSASPKRFRFHVFGHDLSPDDQSAIAATVAAYGAELCAYKIDESHFRNVRLPEETHFGIENLFRLAIPELLPPDVHYALYLDCDILATGDLADLFPLDWCGEAMAAGVFDPFSNPLHAKSFGLAHGRYINAGVLVINVDGWRREKVLDRAVEWICEMKEKAPLLDQDALNVLFAGRLQYLPEIWNYNARGAGDAYPEEDVRLVHFIGRHKPWHYHFRHPLKMEYFRYLSMTPFAGRPPLGRTPSQVWREISRTFRFFLSHPGMALWMFNLKAMKNRILYNHQQWPTPQPARRQ
ncbi:MAG: glycosyltransferase family 8 protein, partial [Lentisphaeria bacterium]|nr:glycosyltransferase family 8 protein [Lentisphaeria bacterium]